MGYRAFILAGGKGTRLAPYTFVLPKPLLPIGERPILDLVLAKLAREGCGHATLCIGYLGTLVRTFCGSGERWSLPVDYFEEDAPLGTVGALGTMERPEDDAFVVMNGDVLTDLDVSKVLEAHHVQGAELTIAGVTRRVKEELGVLEVDGSGRLTGYREKPEHRYLVSTGIYVFSSSVLDLIEPGKRMDLPDLASAMLATDRHVHVHHHDGFWLDIGRPDDFAAANEDHARVVALMTSGVA